MDHMELCKCPCPEKECIIAPKIFDQCRIQACLTPSTIGAAKFGSIGHNCCKPNCGNNDNLVPPSNAVSVAVRNFYVTDVNVINKSANSLRCGYWDITVKFVFSYCLVFFNSDSDEIGTMSACNTYTTTLTLYGGENMCVSVFNELYPDLCKNGPFVGVEANGMALAACLSYPCPTTVNNCCGCGHCGGSVQGTIVKGCECTSPNSSTNPVAVNVTIGLFAVVKIFRLSNIGVENLGDCIPEDCSAVSPETMDPCKFFDSLDFPINLFAPQSDYTPSSCHGITTDILGSCNDCNYNMGSNNSNCGCNNNSHCGCGR